MNTEIRTKYGDLQSKYPYLVRIQENKDQKRPPYLDTFYAVLFTPFTVCFIKQAKITLLHHLIAES